MIKIVNKQDCCGCGACVQKCPKQCISLHEDNEGFLYPKVDSDKCIDCGLCEEVCLMGNPFDIRKPIHVFAAINKDEKIRMESSSGGIFTLLAEKVINEGGVVFGARFDAEWQVSLDYTENIEDLALFRGSKYVQARTGNAYQQCEKFLKLGRKVLFAGTQCQIAGLHHYLRNEYDNLTTCDLVCHGVPSPKVWRLFLREIIDGTNRVITNIEFRNKDYGWKACYFKLSYDEKTKTGAISSSPRKNLFMRAFLSDMILRPSCYDCKAKQGRSMSDITIADFWGIHNSHPEMDDDKGTSLVMVHTVKGKTALDWSRTNFIETRYDEAKPYNRFNPSMPVHRNRAKFFNELNRAKSVSRLIVNCTKAPLKARIRSRISLLKRILTKVIKIPVMFLRNCVKNPSIS